MPILMNFRRLYIIFYLRDIEFGVIDIIEIIEIWYQWYQISLRNNILRKEKIRNPKFLVDLIPHHLSFIISFADASILHNFSNLLAFVVFRA